MKKLSSYVMSVLYVVAGIAHFMKPAMYMRIMPPYLPAPLFLVYLSGAAEILLGAMVSVPRFTRLASWGIIALLIAVFPANIYMLQLGGAAFGLPQWVLVARLPLQALLIGWAYWQTR